MPKCYDGGCRSVLNSISFSVSEKLGSKTFQEKLQMYIVTAILKNLSFNTTQ